MTIRPLAALAVAFSLASAVTAHATIVVNLQADLLKDQNGVAIPQTATFLLVASTLDGTFGTLQNGAALTLGSVLTGAGGDDVVIYKGDLSGYGVNGVLDKGTLSLDPTNAVFNGAWNTGDPLALIWFTSAVTSLTTGQRYGIYTRSTAVDGSVAWTTPSDGTYNLGFFTKDGGELSPGSSAANNASAGNASNTVVPEPATAGLAMLGGIAMLARRRRRA